MHSRKSRLFILIMSILMICSGYINPSIKKVHAAYASKNTANARATVAKWSLKVNSHTTSETVTINLEDTITTNSYSNTSVIPGTKGRIEIDLDFSETEVDTVYSISTVDENTILPSNLKLYSDSAMTQELTTISGSVSSSNTDTIVNRYIYWKWDFTDTDETSDWSGKDITLQLVLNASQAYTEAP